MVGRWISFWDGLFSGATLVSGRVTIWFFDYLHPPFVALRCLRNFAFARELWWFWHPASGRKKKRSNSFSVRPLIPQGGAPRRGKMGKWPAFLGNNSKSLQSLGLEQSSSWCHHNTVNNISINMIRLDDYMLYPSVISFYMDFSFVQYHEVIQ